MPPDERDRMLPPEERIARLEQHAVEATKEIVRLTSERNDALVGMAAVILDLYRVQFRNEPDDKDSALLRLAVQKDDLLKRANGLGAVCLEWVMENLRNDKLDAASLLTKKPHGQA
jgi:hypothetical protein